MANYQRALLRTIKEAAKTYPCILLVGPHLVGKTSLVMRQCPSENRWVTFTVSEEQDKFFENPEEILSTRKKPVVIDDIPYAPKLFRYVKERIDEGATPGSFYLIGSQPHILSRLARDEFGELVAIFNLHGLSQSEIWDSGDSIPFVVEQTLFDKRRHRKVVDKSKVYERILAGTLPELYGKDPSERSDAYLEYLNHYVDNVITELVSPSDNKRFKTFVRYVASEAGKVPNLHILARKVGISDDTAKRWVRIMEKSGIIFFLRPYSDACFKYALKKPKLYFFDTGFAAYLTNCTSLEDLVKTGISETILNNFVVSEIMKSYHNAGQEGRLWYYQDKRGNYIDLIVESNGKLYPIAITSSNNPSEKLVDMFSVIDKGRVPRSNGAVFSFSNKRPSKEDMNKFVPIWML